MSKSTNTYEFTERMISAIRLDPVSYIKAWWAASSTEDERRAADERGASAEGAFSFVEAVVRKYNKKTMACLPDRLTFEIAGIFLRKGMDGDEPLTMEELDRREKDEAIRRQNEEDRRRKAEEEEEKRLSSLTPEQIAEEKRVKEEREARARIDEARRKEEAAMRAMRIAKAERAKAIAEEMEKNQMCFDFFGNGGK